MRVWLTTRWEEIRTSFWFVPAIMVAGAIALSLATIHLDRASTDHNWVATLGWTFTRGPEGSRAVLSTVANSMMTIASVTFSITVVALQLASTQFGPRLLRNFMRDRGNQVAIGTFIATFTYCLLVLRTVNGTEREQFVPHVSVTVGLLLALASLGVLIYFIHHAAASIQAENVIAAVGRELGGAIDTLYPERLGDEASDAEPGRGAADVPERFAEESRPIPAPRSDFLQAIDVDHLLRVACDHDLLLSVGHRPGCFLFQGDELLRAWPGERVDDELTRELLAPFYFGPRRSLTQDVEFAIEQLVEIAVRALSPGVNDPFTAISCVDRLGAALCTLAGRSVPAPYRYDDGGRLRVFTDASTISGIVDASFHLIRQASRGDMSVTIRLLETIAAVARHTRDPVFRSALRRQADAILRGSERGNADPVDLDDVTRRHRAAIEALDGQGDAAEDAARESS